MNPNFPFGMPPIDPSKMDPQTMMRLSQLIQELPPEKLNQMSSLMHNAMGGFDVRKEMEAFEQSLPPGFREKMMSIIAGQAAAEPIVVSPSVPTESAEASSKPAMDLHQARITVLRAVAEGRMSPEQAETVLFPAS